jgi:hypothetical protein
MNTIFYVAILLAGFAGLACRSSSFKTNANDAATAFLLPEVLCDPFSDHAQMRGDLRDSRNV